MARNRSARRFATRLFLVLLLPALVGLWMGAFRAGAPAEITIESDLPGIGRNTTLTVRLATEGRGLDRVRVELVQEERVTLLEQQDYEPQPPWKPWADRTLDDTLTLAVRGDAVDGLREGEAIVRVSAGRAPSWLRSPQPEVRELRLPVRLRPPSLHVGSTRTYVRQGGCEVVVYRVGETSVRDGVVAGDWFFPGYRLPGGGERDRFALFAAPFDMGDAEPIKLMAEDDVGNRALASFIDHFKPAPPHTDRIRVTERFMERVVPAVLAQTPEIDSGGSLLEQYLRINGELRQSNAKTLVELAERTHEAFLFSRRFLQLPNSQVTSTFADRRTYLYDGQEIDRQDHLGFDLASVGRAEVPAANDGVVLLARYFGIYGNAVVVDHGYGLMSLYGHLSAVTVEQGQEIARGDVLGRTGDTGLAGGDHLHFTMLLHGLPVNPKEWWDGRWIRNRIAAKLAAAFPFEG